MKQAYIFLIAFALLFSCKKQSGTSIGNGSVIVVNEGGFNHGNASISLYNPVTKTISNNIFQEENGFALGDVAQDLYLVNDTAYIVMNNSQNIVIANAANNFKYIDTIYLPGSSPRFFLPVGGSKAYVTELYANKIWVIDFRKRILLKTIPVNGWTEQMVSWNGNIYVEEQTTPGGSPVHAVLMINPVTDQIGGSVSLASDPSCMALTGQNQLFVMCPVPIDSPNVIASLYDIDMASFSIKRRMNFPASQTPDLIRYSSFSGQLLYSNNGIYAMSPTDTVLPTSVFIPSNAWNVYGLNANPANGDIYVSNALDYQQASSIMRFSQSGTSLDAFSAGIITNSFVFE